MSRVLVLVLVLAGCDSDPDASKPGPLPPNAWSALVETSFSLAPGQESYWCATKTLAHDVATSRLRPVVPPGVHHVVLSITSPSEPDGAEPCSPVVEGHRLVFAGGLGTGELALPEGVALTIPAGTQLLLQLHLLNPSTSALSGQSGVEGFVVAPEDVDREAEVILAGKVDGLTVVPGASTEIGRCTLPIASTLFAVMPHMHARGTRLSVSSGANTLYDQPFDVDTQSYTLLSPPAELALGSVLEIACSYENPGTETLGYGAWADDEMCFAALVRHPAASSEPFCTE